MTNREIDALIAGHVFSLVRVLTRNRTTGEVSHTEYFRPAGDIGAQFIILPLYSTDPTASKQLRDRMRELGFWCQMRNEWGPEYPGCWAGFTPNGVTGWNGTPDNWTQADTEEMSVSLAALSALGVTVA